MFAARYFTPRAFAPRYFAEIGATQTVTRFVALTLGRRPSYTVRVRPALTVEA